MNYGTPSVPTRDRKIGEPGDILPGHLAMEETGDEDFLTNFHACPPVVEKPSGPRILIVTPEIAYVPDSICSDARRFRAKAGGLGDVSGLLFDHLTMRNENTFLAIPHYRSLFRDDDPKPDTSPSRVECGDRIFMTEDCRFYRRNGVYQASRQELIDSALIFQNDVITRIIPTVKPDIIHCNDWMTGLIPGAARKLGIPSLFTIHNIHSEKASLADLDNRGVPARDFWRELYFDHFPESYDESFWTNHIDMLASGIMAADYVNVVSPSFLHEMIEGHHHCVPEVVRHLLHRKLASGRATGVLNAPDCSFDSTTDPHLLVNYNAVTHATGKAANKRAFQWRLGLEENPSAPLFYWPSRLDPMQKGCQLLTEVLGEITSRDFVNSGIQFAFIADGEIYQNYLREIVAIHGLEKRVTVADFSESLSHLAYAASDFVLMPSSYEPCGLPQMIGACYGALPVAHKTGGLRDTVTQLDPVGHSGNGFLFENFDPGALKWAIGEAVHFHLLPATVQETERKRIILESAKVFSVSKMIDRYEMIYREILGN